MSEEMVVRQAAPTLAGIKTGSLFSCPCDSPEELRQEVRRINRLLAGKGLCLLPLRFDGGRALLYLYRPSRLRQDLEDAEAVRQDTGWFKGTDGKWRFEINDADAKLLKEPSDPGVYADIFDEGVAVDAGLIGHGGDIATGF